MEMHVDSAGASAALNLNWLLVGGIFLIAGLAFLLSAAGLISVLVSGGRRRGLPHALGGLALSGLALVVVPIMLVMRPAQFSRDRESAQRIRIEQDAWAEQMFRKVQDRQGRPFEDPVITITPIPVPSPLPDPFEPIWPTKDDPLPGGLQVQMKADYHSEGGELNLPQLLSMAGVESERRSVRCLDATVMKLKNSAYRIYAFRFSEGGELRPEADGDRLRTVTVLGRGEVRLVILCTSPDAARESTYLELVAYFKRRLEAAKLDSW